MSQALIGHLILSAVKGINYLHRQVRGICECLNDLLTASAAARSPQAIVSTSSLPNDLVPTPELRTVAWGFQVRMVRMHEYEITLHQRACRRSWCRVLIYPWRSDTNAIIIVSGSVK